MSELRWHPFLRQWVITATHRQDRTFHPPDDYCPLCPTRPGGFPTEVPADDYDIAVFENKFPSLLTPPHEPSEAWSRLQGRLDPARLQPVRILTPYPPLVYAPCVAGRTKPCVTRSFGRMKRSA